MNNHIIKETSDEVVYLRKLLQQYKIDIKNNKISKDNKLKSIDNFIRLTQIIYSKINYGKDLMS
tara:strand:- start:7765 stop:7956 length:192 start_codon:yes stop_codon:yes gene_type:complete